MGVPFSSGALAGIFWLTVFYCGLYSWLRIDHNLVRTGVLYNVRLEDGRLAPEGGWMHSGVHVGNGKPGAAWLEVVFRPAIEVESAFWDTLGRRLRIH